MTDPIPGFAEFVEGSCYETRKKWKEFSKQDIFKPRFNLSLRDQKELALERLKIVAQQKVYSVYDFAKNPLNVFANHEMAGLIDGSMCTKLTVQLNLFGGTLFTLGSERHLQVAEGVDNLSTIGCFALTELGYGNNAVQMGTTAHYNKKKETFSINTPTTLSQKYWITNGAYHCNYALVFAQLIMPGDKHEGVHVFLVRVRNEDGSIRDGVFIEDMGAKLGLNGVDNGRLKFTNVEVPREALLNKFSEVDSDGKFTSVIKNKRQRFLTVADRLLSGRLCIASMISSACKIGLINTLRYGNKRLAMGKSGLSDTSISEFGLFQNQIYPLLARTIILNTGFNTIKELYAESLIKKQPASTYLVCLCCSIKPLITWNTRDVATTVVERVGGQGYLAANRLGEIIAFAHSGITAEGDNGVLMQKTAKELVGLIQKGEYKTPRANLNKEEYDFSQSTTYIDLLRLREGKLISEIAKITSEKLGKGKDIYNVWVKEDNDIIQNIAKAFGERTVAEFALERIQKGTKSDKVQEVLNVYLKLYLNSIVLKDLGWFIYNNLISVEQAKVVNEINRKLIKSVHSIALDTVNSFGVPEHLLTAPIAQDYEQFNVGKNEGEVYKPKL